MRSIRGDRGRSQRARLPGRWRRPLPLRRRPRVSEPGAELAGCEGASPSDEDLEDVAPGWMRKCPKDGVDVLEIPESSRRLGIATGAHRSSRLRLRNSKGPP